MNTEQLKTDPMKETEQTLLDQIKDKVANRYGYNSWQVLYDLRQSKYAILKLMDEVCELHATAKAQASCEATLIKAAEKAKIAYSNEYHPSIGPHSIALINKSSITDPKNITIV